jgi:hypothetical protein
MLSDVLKAQFDSRPEVIDGGPNGLICLKRLLSGKMAIPA